MGLMKCKLLLPVLTYRGTVCIAVFMLLCFVSPLCVCYSFALQYD